ncbi:hypothetical protein MKJ04_19825 [Pontibacter sp. E15-1]|uniref:hypothetical protein n=1 Tax=Pontibacter sp. E15-1 TaxID=2919918 RepID=UPI001F4FCBDF|nr:hypothetical protein [Pontibacter sp. E15-1]MCJ8167101.1 hypothetical protein [Pontibacter sp. E15-1]
MKVKLKVFEIAVVISTLIFLISYTFQEQLFKQLWIIALVPLVISGLLTFLIFAWAIVYHSRVGLTCGLIALSAIGLGELLKSELLKSKIVLQATLKDDLSYMHLTLRENQKFEMVSSHMFGDKEYIGKYKLIGDKLIFLDKVYDNSFIPDTVFIWNDKIILKHRENGEPEIGFASYFDIKKNTIKNKSQ